MIAYISMFALQLPECTLIIAMIILMQKTQLKLCGVKIVFIGIPKLDGAINILDFIMVDWTGLCSLMMISVPTEKGEPMAKEICQDCGKVFEGGAKAFLCHDCRRRRLSKAAKKRSLNKIGNEAYSKQQAAIKAERDGIGNG